MAPETFPTVTIVLLAAGQSSRMGGEHHKLLAEFDGVPLVRRMAEVAGSADPAATIVVTGHRHEEIMACLAGLPVEIVRNPAYIEGMASSIISGFAVPSVADADGVMIMLADMPEVTGRDLRALIAAFREAKGGAIVRAVSDGRRGNPVVMPQSLRGAILKLEGDVGARKVIETCGLPIIDVEIGNAAHIDVDTPEVVLAAGGVLKG
jgi:molybdenum cofactor cytidylyltransferase